MSFRCDCCGTVPPPKSKAYIVQRDVQFRTPKVIGEDEDGLPVEEEVPVYTTQQTLCEVCNTGRNLGIPDSRLKEMGGQAKGNSKTARLIKTKLAVSAPPPIKVRRSKLVGLPRSS